MKLVGRVPRELLKDNAMVRLDYPPWHVLVAMVQGEPAAIEDACNHAGASLVDGFRDGSSVVCPMHGYVFHLSTGELLTPKGLCDDQRRFTAKVEGEEVAVYDAFDVKLLMPTR